jgi:valyl-tRNA synthetase
LPIAISDLEVQQTEVRTPWYLRYPLEGKTSNPDDPTASRGRHPRPKPCFGDSAVAIHRTMSATPISSASM